MAIDPRQHGTPAGRRLNRSALLQAARSSHVQARHLSGRRSAFNAGAALSAKSVRTVRSARGQMKVQAKVRKPSSAAANAAFQRMARSAQAHAEHADVAQCDRLTRHAERAMPAHLCAP